MKVLVIGPSNLRLMPYLFGYLEELSRLKCDITLFYWDRDGKKDWALPTGVQGVCYQGRMKNFIPRYFKIFKFWGYRKAVFKLLKTQSFDRIIISNAQFAVLLSDILLRDYRKKYIFDYRDPSLEKYAWFKQRVAAIVLNSKATFISSDAYRELLPKYANLYTVHNILRADLNYREVRRSLPREREVIRIAFWGYIRDTAVNLALIKELGNDRRFELHYYGVLEKTAEAIRWYCQEKGINNVSLHQEYLPEERYEFAKTTDMLHNAYNNEGGSNPSMGNKFYEGLIFYLPQICTDGGFMGNEAVKRGVGIALDFTKPFAALLYEYYLGMNWPDFEQKCDSCLETVLKEQEESNLNFRKALE